MVQNEWGRVFPFQNVRIFENRSTKNNFASIWKMFQKKSNAMSQKRYFSNGNPMQNRWCGSNIRKFHHRPGNFRSCLEAARYRTSWAARCEFFNDLKSTINLRLVSFQNVAPHSLGCREQKLVHMDMPNVSIFFCFPGDRSVLAGHGFQWAQRATSFVTGLTCSCQHRACVTGGGTPKTSDYSRTHFRNPNIQRK